VEPFTGQLSALLTLIVPFAVTEAGVCDESVTVTLTGSVAVTFGTVMLEVLPPNALPFTFHAYEYPGVPFEHVAVTVAEEPEATVGLLIEQPSAALTINVALAVVDAAGVPVDASVTVSPIEAPAVTPLSVSVELLLPTDELLLVHA
jgi:hypothetical protein